MARARNIKPGFFANEVLAECDPLARLLFAGLWCWADREGRLEDRPRKIKVQVLPYDRCDVGKLLDQLATHEFIRRYESEGRKYIQVLTFHRHQNPHVNESPSTIPPPQSTVQEPDEHSANPADSLNPITDSLNPQPALAAVEIPEPLNLPPFPAAWSEWLDYRRERRLSLRDRTMRAQLQSLVPLGPVAAAECLGVSIRNGWQGIFPEKTKNGKRSLSVGAGQTFDPGGAERDPNFGKM
jgi:hypothetical protein